MEEKTMLESVLSAVKPLLSGVAYLVVGDYEARERFQERLNIYCSPIEQDYRRSARENVMEWRARQRLRQHDRPLTERLYK